MRKKLFWQAHSIVTVAREMPGGGTEGESRFFERGGWAGLGVIFAEMVPPKAILDTVSASGALSLAGLDTLSFLRFEPLISAFRVTFPLHFITFHVRTRPAQSILYALVLHSAGSLRRQPRTHPRSFIRCARAPANPPSAPRRF